MFLFVLAFQGFYVQFLGGVGVLNVSPLRRSGCGNKCSAAKHANNLYQIHTYFILQYVQAEPPTKESLCQLVIQFIQYQETKLGKIVHDPVLTRLPVR